MRSNIIEAYKQGLKLSDKQREVLIGLLLGDGHLETQNNGRTYRLKIEHSYLQKEYVDWLYQVFKDWVLTSPKEKEQTVLGIKYNKYYFSTVSHGAFRFYAQQFYKEKKKVLPKLIKKWLSPIVMAVWFMDDGSVKSKRHRALILNTQSFSKSELQTLVGILEERFGVRMVLRKQSRKQVEIYQLITTSESVERFVEIIKPYILPSMRYKLGILGTQLPKK
ncbi:MAG: hypothetical protein HY505_02865 [Candidatus Yanofskybacteria bacterium]|nr:hypothetical protein [Candidatus Yanofskybacteria bacterium]MBI4158531.1 hypothetical protein [Candidatus Yanofskybacteria bacterium]